MVGPKAPDSTVGVVPGELKAPLLLPDVVVPATPNAPKPVAGLKPPKAGVDVSDFMPPLAAPNAILLLLGDPAFPKTRFSDCGCCGHPKAFFWEKIPPDPKAFGFGWPKAESFGCGCCWFCSGFDDNDGTLFVPNIVLQQRRSSDEAADVEEHSSNGGVTCFWWHYVQRH